ncbi:hypothetical protein LWX53_09715, partial [bacterium]|nr:hypothetical protein [bacterium]
MGVFLVAFVVISFSSRDKGAVQLSEGEALELPGGEVLRLTADRYVDGRPKDWISVVSVEKDGKPLNLGGMTLSG